MSITHCPLCVGLAVLSAVRFMAHGLMLWPLVRPQDQPAGPPAGLQAAWSAAGHRG